MAAPAAVTEGLTPERFQRGASPVGIVLWILVILVIAALIKYLLTDQRRK